MGSAPHNHLGIQADGGSMTSMAALGIEAQPAGRSRKNAGPPGRFYEPGLDVADITSAHIPLAVLSHMAPANPRGSRETV